MALTTINPSPPPSGDKWSVAITRMNAVIQAVNKFTGGTAGQILKKTSSSDFFVTWETPVEPIDTGWVSVPLVSGRTGTLFLRRMGNVVYMDGSSVGGSGSDAVTGTLPVDFQLEYNIIEGGTFGVNLPNQTVGGASLEIQYDTLVGNGSLDINFNGAWYIISPKKV